MFTSLNHYLDVEWLKAAYGRVKPDSAPGVDGQRWVDYGKDLEKNLLSLLNRVKSGSYVAPPVKRVNIPKGDGKETRPIGMPTIEDKVLQRAIAMLLEPIYEQDFKFFSYGFRPGRSAHEALASLWSQSMRHPEAEQQRIRLEFLPPYSPNLNPIERLWKFVRKMFFKDRYRDTFAKFCTQLAEFFANLDQYRKELSSLLTEKFELIPEGWQGAVCA